MPKIWIAALNFVKYNEKEILQTDSDHIREMEMNYLFLANGFEIVEALAVVDMLRRANMPVTTVSMNGIWEVESAQKVLVRADALFEELSFSDAEFLILPGGMPGTKNLRAHEGLCDLLKKQAGEQGDIAAICAAPYVLGELGILEGYKACCYPGFEDRLLGTEVLQEGVVTCKNIITARGMGRAVDFGATIIAKSLGQAMADNILSQIQAR